MIALGLVRSFPRTSGIGRRRDNGGMDAAAPVGIIEE